MKATHLQPIQFIYFDLGNVLVQFDPARGCQNVADWAGVDPDVVRQAVWDSGLEDAFEHGQLSPLEFAAGVLGNLRHDAAAINSHGQPLLDLLSNMFTPLEEMVPLIEELQAAGMGLGILSNTCHAHWDWILRQQWPVAAWSTTNVLSFEIKHMKPATEIYAAAERLAGVPPQTIFFTDDREENVAGARAAGWQTHPFQNPADLRQHLQSLGLLGSSGAVRLGASGTANRGG